MPEAEGAAPSADAPAAEPRSHGLRPSPSESAEDTLVPERGWHVLHLFYRVDRGLLAQVAERERTRGRAALVEILDPARQGRAVEQAHCFAIPGHKADFGLILAGPDLPAIHAVQQDIQASPLGPALVPAWSFYSITEVSEYVPDAEEYARILRDREHLDPETDSFKTRVAQYSRRIEPMNQDRLYPRFPAWPCLCFYPMSKLRQAGQNWYLLPFRERSDLMNEHGKSGMKFAGRVKQLITASTGLDDWEWGVTLWARNPSYLKEIVYTMRFDESSARYALFGPFYFGMIQPPAELVGAIRL